MHSATKLRTAYSTYVDTASMKAGIQETLVCRPISSRRPLPTPLPPQTKQSLVMMNPMNNDHTNEILTHSILIDNAARRRGFLPYYYRTANTLEAIRRQHTHYKPSSKLPPTFLPVFHRSSTLSRLSDNVTNSEGELTERNLIIHDKSIGKTHRSSPVLDKQANNIRTINNTDFITEIPNSLEFVLQNTTRKSTMERSLFENLKRQRLEHTRYRLLPINRAPYA